MTKPLQKGDVIRLKVRTVFGWQGYGVVKEDMVHHDPDATVSFHRVGHSPDETCIAKRHQMALVRNRWTQVG
jgi:hypothetical protein